MSVHLPIGVLAIALLFKLISGFRAGSTWKTGGSVLLYIGTAGAWVAIYTGDLADGIVSRELCDPTILKDHENGAYITAWLFTAASIIDLLTFLGSRILKKTHFTWLVILLMTVGTGFLGYVGHLGATLVYQQAAGVYTPSDDCAEFE
ncbi:MAG: DUF2231 domain-containing protein [Cryomorphaceae bacterium]|nr:hypothetical protein [Flavobacteriales bacterium]